jgi:hypothetical protein
MRSTGHERNRRALSNLRPAGDLETVTLVERDCSWIRGFEIGRKMIVIDGPKAVLYQFATETLTL